MLREIGRVEQRYQAVREVLNDGASVTDVARRNDVSRQTVHEWLVKYANRGLPGLMDRPTKPVGAENPITADEQVKRVSLRESARPGRLRVKGAFTGFLRCPGLVAFSISQSNDGGQCFYRSRT